MVMRFFTRCLIGKGRPLIESLTRHFRHVLLSRRDKIETVSYLLTRTFRQGMNETGFRRRIPDDIYQCSPNSQQNTLF
uniref:Uncharacterized protein n=1 Tax=Candidatus Kentrum sp. FW TaxID=2126338 RepID=A0A450TY86_9GAMM|nr:MAG: hypothetical protein BECKFW1821C_GA0114237_106319 [Candidatus Kentron sp. FW]